MQRCVVAPRPQWPKRLEELGFTFHSSQGTYWDESVCYRFRSDQIDELEDATETLHRLCLEAVDHVIEADRFEALRIPAAFVPSIRASWRERAPSLYGRFDLAYDGVHPPKLLEYNADTPTALFEAAVVQWHWLEETGRPDQFNSIHEKLIERWREIDARLPLGASVHFSCVQDSEEDLVTVEYLRDVASQAGLSTRTCFVEEIGWDGRAFVDLDDEAVRVWFKLYPWEWLMREEFGAHLLVAAPMIVEPAWKALLSTKAILPILWELFPGHPNLLASYFDPAPLGDAWVRKPIHGREGANVRVETPGVRLATEGPYENAEAVYQQWAPPASFDGHHPILGSWIVGDRAAGIGIREDVGPVTTDESRFVPHYFDP